MTEQEPGSKSSDAGKTAATPAPATDSDSASPSVVQGSSGHGVRRLWRRLKPYSEAVGLLIGAGTILAFVSAAFVFFLGSRELMLTAWFREVTPVYPSKTTGGAELPLEISGEAVHTAKIVDLQVSNTGKQLIGKQEDTFALRLRGPEGTQVRVVGQPSSEPHNQLVAQWSQSQNNEITFQLRAVESRGAVGIRLLVLNADASSRASIDVSTSLAGVPLETTTLSPQERKRDRLFLPFFVIFIPVFVVLMYRERRAAERDKKERPRWASALVLIVIASSALSFMTAAAMGWILTLFD